MTTAILTQGKVSASLLSLTLPMILGISSSLIAALFEIYLIGLLGTNELAAYSFTFSVVMALNSLMLGLSIGLSSVLARAVGSGEEAQITRITTDGIALMGITMLLAALFGFFSIDQVFRLMGADSVTLPLIRSYMQIWYFGLILMALPMMGANALRATGDARISSTIMVAGAAMQMLIDPILILGLLNFPKLGIDGAAWSMIISRGVLCIATFYVLIYKKNLIVLGRRTIASMIQSWKMILIVGLPATATNLIGPVSTAIIVSLLAGFGTEVVAGFGIASRLEALSVIPLFALSASIGPFVGQNWGAELRSRANRGMKLACAWAMCWGLLVALVFLLFHDDIAQLFDTNDQVVETASLYLMLVPISYGTWGVLMMTSAIFNSLGKPLTSTSLSIIRMIIIYIPLAFIGQHYFGVIGIFAATCLANIFTGVLAYIWNRKVFMPLLAEQKTTTERKKQ
ncbi:MAG: MATE family efflux transporter [Pseudomonadales bacterium]|nr:MATE family efflux transporter [Pseudomonadales bacterium]